MSLPQFQDSDKSFGLMQNAWAKILNPVITASRVRQWYVSPPCTAFGTLASTGFTTFSNTPTLTFKTDVTAKFKVYGTFPVTGSTTSGFFVRITATGSPTIVFSQDCYVESALAGTASNISPFVIVTLHPNTTYTFTLQGRSSGGATINLRNDLPANGTVIVAEEI